MSKKQKKTPAVPPQVREFRSLADTWLRETHRLFPQEASEQGLHEFDAELGENDAALHRTYGDLLQSTLARVEALPDAPFQGDDWLDRRGFVALLRTSLLFHRRETWRINPQVHCDAAVNAIFQLVLRNPENLREVHDAMISRLEKLPRFLSQGAVCVRTPVPLWTKLAVQSCQGAEAFLSEIGAQLAAVSPKPTRVQTLIEGAKKAFASYARTIRSKAAGPKNSYALGRADFEYLLRERTGFSYSTPEVRALGEHLVEDLSEQLRAEARSLGRGTPGEIISKAAARWQPREASLLEEYQRVTGEVRKRFEKAKIVTFPQGEQCRVMLVPPFLRHQFPTAAYHAPGPFAEDQTGIFWVNDLSLEQRTPETRAAEVRQHFGLEFTCAHEAYPGHHLQFCVQNQHPSRLRRLMHHALGYEGWTLWCEKMSVDAGIIDFPEARLSQLHDALWRAHRIVIDCGLHDRSLSFEAACQRLVDGVGFTPARARGDVNWYTSAPTVPLSYLLGRLEVERLHQHFTAAEGWSMRKFNDWLLSFGALPPRWLWEAQLRS